MLLGNWRNIEEMEISLSLPELEQIIKMSRKVDELDKEFFAGINGVDIRGTSKFDEIKEKVKNKLNPVKTEKDELSDLGIDVVEE